MPHPITKQTVRLSPSATSATPNRADPAWAAWQRHLDGGRIVSRRTLSVESHIRMMRNEIALFGRIVTRALERF
jgi:hypothetical protein